MVLIMGSLLQAMRRRLSLVYIDAENQISARLFRLYSNSQSGFLINKFDIPRGGANEPMMGVERVWTYLPKPIKIASAALMQDQNANKTLIWLNKFYLFAIREMIIEHSTGPLQSNIHRFHELMFIHKLHGGHSEVARQPQRERLGLKDEKTHWVSAANEQVRLVER